MGRVWPVRYLLFAIFCSCLWGQNSLQERLQQAHDLEQRGQFELAVEILRPLTGSQQISEAEAGRVWILLGYAFQEQSDFANARNCYERATRIYRDKSSDKADYGAALDYLADLHRAIGKLSAARKIEKSSLEQYREAGDHAGAAWGLMHLAVIELTRKRRFDAQSDLDEADKEAQLAQNPGDEFFAALYSTKGWLAELEGNTSTAISYYTQSLVFRKCSSCMLTGWEYMLLGKAYADDGQVTAGLTNMRTGLKILSDTSGQHSSRYLAAQIAYAQALDASGEHAESAALKVGVERELHALNNEKCALCREGLVGNP
jgi:tetratricopeptide (TPR) repeat protein